MIESNDNKLFLILDNNPSNPPLRKMIEDHWPILDRSSSTQNLLNYKIIFGFRKPKSLMDLLCHTDIKRKTSIKNIIPKCRIFLKCTHCPRLDHNKLIKSSSTSRTYRKISKFSCNTQNAIYCIECELCGAQYVGQTKNAIRIRMNNHISTIRNQGDTPVARHFNKHGFRENPPMKISVLQLIREDPKSLRDKWEQYWMSRLYTLTLNGMNIQD